MSDTSSKSPPTLGVSRAYADSWEHLADELRCLDLLLLDRVNREFPSKPSSPFEQLQGLVLSEEEIKSLLRRETGGAGPPPGTETRQNKELADHHRELESTIRARLKASAEQNVFLGLPALAELFGLNDFECQCLLICLAPEVDRKYEKIYAYLQDDVTRKRASVDLVLNLLCSGRDEKLAARSAFYENSRLRRYRLLRISDSSAEAEIPLLSRFLKLDERIVGFLLGSGEVAPELQVVARLTDALLEPNEVPVPDEVWNRVSGLLTAHFKPPFSGQGLLLHVHGRSGSGRSALAGRIARQLGWRLLVSDARKMTTGTVPFEPMALLLCREAVLQPLVICLEHFDHLVADDIQSQVRLESLIESIRTFSQVTVLLGEASWSPRELPQGSVFVEIECRPPDVDARKQLWENFLETRMQNCEPETLRELSGKYRFTPGQIRDAVSAAEQLAWLRSPADPRLTQNDLYAACRGRTTQKLGALAQKVEALYEWDDLVLPADQMQQLREIAIQVKHDQIVMGEWGFSRKLSRGRGLTSLFSGPSGTGKTMAAEVIARELNLDLVKVDLSGVVSKYIGETEKNLNRVFAVAEDHNAILFFDEADALFGKRSEVKDAHDRYANIEIAYLLQKMEDYRGVVILATNIRKNMDEAFIRRMRFIVEFPFPDEGLRERIWTRIFPENAPIDEDVDYRFLARKLDVTGGNIRNIAVRAAYLAAVQDRPIEMDDLITAAKRELQKMGRLYSDADFAPWFAGAKAATAS